MPLGPRARLLLHCPLVVFFLHEAELHTFLIEGAAPSRLDNEILAALQLAAREPPGGENVVGFRNESGAIYRRAVLDGVLQLLTLSYRLEELGLEDELAGKPRFAGFDAIFTSSRALHGARAKLRNDELETVPAYLVP